MNTLKILLIPHGVHAPPYQKKAIAPVVGSWIYELILHISKPRCKRKKGGLLPYRPGRNRMSFEGI